MVRIDEALLGFGKAELMAELTRNGIANWHANFELINSLTFFRVRSWRDWILRGDIERVAKNNRGPFPAAERTFGHDGLGLGKSELPVSRQPQASAFRASIRCQEGG